MKNPISNFFVSRLKFVRRLEFVELKWAVPFFFGKSGGENEGFGVVNL